MTLRPYTGLKDFPGTRRPGTEHFARSVEYLTAGKLWNNGTFGIRPSTSNQSVQSVHGTGRAVDLDATKVSATRPGCTLAELGRWAQFFVDHAELFGIELVIHYAWKPYGRTWKCSRGTWLAANQGALSGGGQAWADHLHVELDPAHADNPALIDAAWAEIFRRLTPDT